MRISIRNQEELYPVLGELIIQERAAALDVTHGACEMCVQAERLSWRAGRGHPQGSRRALRALMSRGTEGRAAFRLCPAGSKSAAGAEYRPSRRLHRARNAVDPA